MNSSLDIVAKKSLSFVKGRSTILAEWMQGETRFCYLSGSLDELVRYLTEKDVIIGKETAAWDRAALCIVPAGMSDKKGNRYPLPAESPVMVTVENNRINLKGGGTVDP